MEDCKRNAATTVVLRDEAASTTEAAAAKRRKLVVGDNDGQAAAFGSLKALRSPAEEIDDLRIGSLGVNSPANSVAANGDTCSSSGFLRSERSPSSVAAAEAEAEASSCCSSNESGHTVRDELRLVDLEAKSNFEFETADSTTSMNNNNNNNNTRRFSSETVPSSEVCVDSDETESPEKKHPPATVTAPKFPPRDEIEEFFAKAEELEQQRFSEKYNYDIAKDLPLEGRFEWVCLKP